MRNGLYRRWRSVRVATVLAAPRDACRSTSRSCVYGLDPFFSQEPSARFQSVGLAMVRKSAIDLTFQHAQCVIRFVKKSMHSTYDYHVNSLPWRCTVIGEAPPMSRLLGTRFFATDPKKGSPKSSRLGVWAN